MSYGQPVQGGLSAPFGSVPSGFFEPFGAGVLPAPIRSFRCMGHGMGLKFCGGAVVVPWWVMANSGYPGVSHGRQTELPEKVTVQLLEAEPSPTQNLEGKYINKTHSTDLPILPKNPMSRKSAQIWISRFLGTSIYYAKRLSEYTIPERKRKVFSEAIVPSGKISGIAPHKQRVSGFFRGQCTAEDSDKVSACCWKCRPNIPLFRQGRVITPPWRFCR